MVLPGAPRQPTTDAPDADHSPPATGRRAPRGYRSILSKAAGLDRKGITIQGLRSAAISLYAARGLTMLETATVMGQKDPHVTWKHYALLFDRSDVEARVRAAQASFEVR